MHSLRTRVQPLPSQPKTPPPPPSAPPESDELDLAELFGTLVEGRWVIAAFALTALAAAGLYAFSATPIYKSDALLQIEESGGTDPLQDLSAVFSGETPAEAEIEILRSRSVVAKVVEGLHLDLHAAPQRAPLIGGLLARFESTTPRLSLEELELPRAYELEPLTLEATGENAWRLLTEDGRELLKGTVGQPVTANDLTVQVQALTAEPGTKFTVSKQPFSEAVAALQRDLVVREKGKKTGILQLEMQGPDRDQIREILDAIAHTYLQQDISRRAAEAEKTLDFVNSQLPLQHANLQQAERALEQHRTHTGQVDLGIEAQALVDRAAELEKQVTTLELQKSELLQRFTTAHPTVVALQNKLAKLQREKTNLEKQARTLPETELETIRLVRDATVAQQLYVLLLTKGQELNVLKSGTIGNVRVVDAAVTHPRPVSPKKGITLALGLLLGVALGVGFVFARRALNRGVEDPTVLEQSLGLPVYASVPFSEKQHEMARAWERKKTAMQPLATTAPADLAIESLRSLRTALQFSLAPSKNNVILIGGSRPGVGKSFVSINLAHLLADTGRRVLLIDGDLRRGQLHIYFGRQREQGLSELITGGDLDALIHPTGAPNLKFLSSGTLPPNPSELLSSDRFEEVMKQASAKYDLVILDAPPVLAVADAALLARVAGVNLLVAKSGLHPLRELAQAVSRMEQSGARPNGFVFNAVPQRETGYGTSYGYHYAYDYR